MNFRKISILYLISGSIGSLIMGLLMAWSSPSIVFLKSGNNSAPFIMQTEREEEIIAAIMPLGALVGSFFAGFLADLFGRKFTMSIFTLPWIVSWLMTTFAPNVSILYGARFLGGLVGGVFCGILPLYINEIAEDSIRGKKLRIVSNLFKLLSSTKKLNELCNDKHQDGGKVIKMLA